MQQLIIQVSDNSRKEFLLQLLSEFDFVKVVEERFEEMKTTSDQKHSRSFFDSAGIWKNRNVNASELRSSAWRR